MNKETTPPLPVQEPTPWRDMIVVTLVREGINKHKARELADHFAAQPEPVADRAFLEQTLVAMEGVIDVADRNTDEFDALRACVVGLTLMLYTTPPQQQAEPVRWDKPSASFDEWWDGDRRRDTANPFQTDSFSYWAYEGWQAALAQPVQEPLTVEEIEAIGDKVANEQLVGPVSNFRVRFARAIEAKLKELNHG